MADDEAKAQRRADALLVVAAARGYLADVDALLDGKAGEAMPASARARDKRRTPALHYAAGGDRTSCVNRLWSRGADVEAEDAHGRTALHYAAAGRAAEAAAFLASKAGAWVGAPGPGDDSPLHLAARTGHGPTVQALVVKASAADLRDRNARGLTPLGEALLGGGDSGGAAAALLPASAAVGAVDVPAADGWTLLHLAAAAGRLPAVELLLGRGGGIDARTGRAKGAGEAAHPPPPLTPLHAAVLGGSAAVVKALLTAGADAGALDADGRTPADLAAGVGGEVASVLAAAARSKRAPAPSTATTPVTATSHLTPAAAAFLALPIPARIAAARKWAGLDDDAALDAATAGFPPSVRRLARDARDLRHARAVATAVAALHDDDDFQEGARLARVRDAVKAVKADPRSASRYQGDFEAMAVLVGLRRLQGVCAANGRLGVPFERLLVPPGQSAATRAEDAATLADLKTLFEKHVAAVAAAAGEAGGGEGAAAAAAAAILGPDAARPREGEGGGEGGGGSVAVATAAAAAGEPPAPNPNPSPSPISLPDDAVGDTAAAKPWEVFKRDLPTAVAASVIRSLVVVLVAWAVMLVMGRGGSGSAGSGGGGHV